MTKKQDKPDKEYLKKLFLTATADDLKQVCRDYKIKGFSNKRKARLVELVLTSLAEEELETVVEEKEEKWITKSIDSAFDMINTYIGTRFKGFRIVNDSAHEIEMDFEWYKEPSSALVYWIVQMIIKRKLTLS